MNSLILTLYVYLHCNNDTVKVYTQGPNVTGPKMNSRQAPNESTNQRRRVHVTVSVASWRVNLLRNITMQCSENNSQFVKRFAVSDVSE